MDKARWIIGGVLAVAIAALLVPGVSALFFAAGYRWFYVLLLSFCISGLAVPAVRAMALRAGALDEPDGAEGRKIHDRPTALLGGVAVWLGVVGALLANGVWPAGLGPVLATATPLMADTIGLEHSMMLRTRSRVSLRMRR